MAIYRSTKQADAVLASIEYLMNEDASYYLEPYQNGREHGHAITNNGMKVAFSENRNDDNIVVYFGKVGDFERAGNVPSDKVYSKKELFSFKEITKVSEKIIEYLG